MTIFVEKTPQIKKLPALFFCKLTTDGCSSTHIIVNIEPSFGTIGVMLIMLVLFIIFKVLVPCFIG